VHFTAPGVPTYFSGPGLAYGYGYNATTNPAPFDVGSKFGFSFLDGLKTWNGASFVDAGAAEFQAFTGGIAAPSGMHTSGGAGSLAVPAGASSVAFTGDHPENAHSTARFRYLGDGSTPSSAPNGVYLLQLQLSSTQAGLMSDPFFFVLNKGADAAAVQSAVASLNVAAALVQFLPIPEPAGFGLAAFGLAAAVLARHRKS
jgi:hypothetical protein